jgi:hypothetical protein
MAKVKKSRNTEHASFTLSNGTQVPSVETILNVINKSELTTWAHNMGLQGVDSTAAAQEHARAGMLTHIMIQRYLGGPEWDKNAYTQEGIQAIKNAFDRFQERETANGCRMETAAVALPVVSERHGYGGRIDWYGKIDGQLWLVNVKTAKSIDPEDIYQMAATWSAALESGLTVNGARILRLGVDEGTGFQDFIVGRPMLAEAWDVFSAALKLYGLKHTFERKPTQKAA